MTKAGKKNKSISWIILAFMMLAMAYSVLPKTVEAQQQSNYYVTVNPTTQTYTMYTTVGRNWTISFEASWSYGNNSGQAIQNATVTVQVNNSKNQLVNTLNLNSTTGLFSFNYSSSTADVLTFTPKKLATQDGTEWTSNLLDSGNNLYGFQSKSVAIFWDTFQVDLVSYDSSTLGATGVSVNVTYLLLPNEGLNLPESATYSHQTFLPKTVHNASVTINGVNAEETSAGLFTANLSIWLPTSYVLVEVSQKEWATTNTGFSLTHTANEPLWEYAAIIGLVIVGIFSAFLVFLRKSKSEPLSTKKRFADLGAVLLAITSVNSLYWGLIGIDSSLHGFDWIILSIMGLLSFGFGLGASIFSAKRKNQALIIFAVIVPMITNLIFVKASLSMYQLANPWLTLIASFILSIISGVLICNADEVFKRPIVNNSSPK